MRAFLFPSFFHQEHFRNASSVILCALMYYIIREEIGLCMLSLQIIFFLFIYFKIGQEANILGVGGCYLTINQLRIYFQNFLSHHGFTLNSEQLLRTLCLHAKENNVLKMYPFITRYKYCGLGEPVEESGGWQISCKQTTAKTIIKLAK